MLLLVNCQVAKQSATLINEGNLEVYASSGLTYEYTREECTIERKLLYELNWPAWWHLDTLY